MNETYSQGRFPVAQYGDPGLEEYRNNPLISALPPILEMEQVAKILRRRPVIREEEKRLPAAIRVHAVARLLTDFFQPLSVHLALEAKISLLIRGGYKGRNPRTGDYYSHIQNSYERLVKQDVDAFLFESAVSTAQSFSLIGCSGCGKSSALNYILQSYPQAIFHPDHNITQLVYLKIDCPYNGGLKSLCLSFFNAVDKVLHTDYSKKFGQKRLSIPLLMLEMALLATTHAIGILIIDEIQHLNEAKSGGEKEMLNFFVTLTNTIGIPVVMVGTPKAKRLFASELRAARRSTGLGSLYWDRVPKDKAWKALLQKLWAFQWLQQTTPLTEELENAFYHYSQGVLDILIKLFALAQNRAIVTKAERITEKLLEAVYKDEFKPVHPMLEALRSNQPELIAKYGDLHMPDITQKLLAITQLVNEFPKPEIQPEIIGSDKQKKLVKLLIEMGFESDIASVSVDSILSKHPELPISALVHKLTQFSAEPEQQNKAKRKAVMKSSAWSSLPSSDLRFMYTEKLKGSFYDKLKQQGIIFDWDRNLTCMNNRG